MISLGVDIGGTGCKCVAFRDDGTPLAIAYAEYPLAAGQVNLPPEVLTDSVFRVIADCASGLEDPRQVAVITVSTSLTLSVRVLHPASRICRSASTRYRPWGSTR